jgi:hypothetical protein
LNRLSFQRGHVSRIREHLDAKDARFLLFKSVLVVTPDECEWRNDGHPIGSLLDNVITHEGVVECVVVGNGKVAPGGEKSRLGSRFGIVPPLTIAFTRGSLP